MKERFLILAVVAMLALSACTQNEVPPIAEQSQPEESISMQDAEESTTEDPYMQLKTDGYRDQTVQDFDEAFAPYQDGFSGYGQDDPDTDFKKTLMYAKMQLAYDENGETPLYSLSTATAPGQLSFEVLWTIADKSTTTVGQRDDLINLAVERVEAAADALGPDSDDAASELQASANKIADELTADWVTVEIIVETLDGVAPTEAPAESLTTPPSESSTASSQAASQDASASQATPTPAAAASTPISIEKIGAGTVVCVGQIELSSAQSYSMEVSAGSGTGLFVGLYSTNSITSSSGTPFEQRFGSSNQSVSAYFTGEGQATTYYVYVGSSYDGTDITGITGSLSPVAS